MNKVEMGHLLSALQMAQFVTDGFLLVENVVPAEHNRAVLADETAYKGDGYEFWRSSSALRAVFELPAVKGALQSFVGVNPVYDHSYLHIVKGNYPYAQHWHADSVIDTRLLAFDVQAFYFSHATPAEMGATLVLPGSHLRRVNNGSIARYKNIVGQRQLACPGGSIAFLHHGIWHCAQPNRTPTTRYVFKLRLQPGQFQRGLFNLEGYDEPEVRELIYQGHKVWQGNEARLDHVQRAKLWRYVTGDDRVDVSFEGVLSRMGL
jgi:hypothetical protein